MGFTGHQQSSRKYANGVVMQIEPIVPPIPTQLDLLRFIEDQNQKLTQSLNIPKELLEGDCNFSSTRIGEGVYQPAVGHKETKGDHKS